MKKEKDALILVHNYQNEDIQLVADHLGDSLDLANRAKTANNKIIVFCGVSFMAESAKLLALDKTVLHPVKDARCPMADMITPDEIKNLRKKYPDACFMLYINSNIEAKAEVDIICTSANAIDLARKVPQRQIVFLPDKNLGRYVQENVPEKEIITVEGFCYVHEFIYKNELLKTKKEHPDALVISHPEVNEEAAVLSDELLGTGAMLKFIGNSKHKKFIIGTEEGMILRLRRDFPDKIFYPAQRRIICSNMKKIQLSDVHDSLLQMQYEVDLDPDIAKKARIPLEKGTVLA